MDKTRKARKYGGFNTMGDESEEKMADGRKDKSYFARSQKILREWGAPLSGWHCQEVYDVREDDMEAPLHTCELCGCRKVRFVHVMRHPDYFEDVAVGCICAGVMEGDILAARERERLMRSRRNPKHLGVKCRGKCIWTYKGKPIRNFLSAAYAAFNLVDPIPEVNHEE